MKTYEVTYISGHTLRYSIVRVTASTADEAIKKAFDMEGRAFENRLISVKELGK